jgi:ribosomal protein S27E
MKSISGSAVMPIKFRCQHCQQLLGISRSQADAVVDCPRCGRALRVPGVDGKTQPLPTNRPATHADEDLRSALTALSTLTALGEDSTALGKDSSAATTSRAVAKPTVTNGQTKSHAVVQAVQPVARSKASGNPQVSVNAQHDPEVLDPPDAAEAAQRQPDVVSTSTTTAEHPPDEDLLVPLRELADFGKTTTSGSAANSTETLSSHGPSETKRRRSTVVLAIVAVLLLGNGFLFGRGLFSSAGSAPVEGDADQLAL